MSNRGAIRLALLMSMLMLALGAKGLAFAADVQPPFPLFYQGRESLILHRLQLDPSNHVVDTLAAAHAAVYQDGA